MPPTKEGVCELLRKNLSAVRKMGLGLLKRNGSPKKSLTKNRFQALTSTEFREIILKDFL